MPPLKNNGYERVAFNLGEPKSYNLCPICGLSSKETSVMCSSHYGVLNISRVVMMPALKELYGIRAKLIPKRMRQQLIILLIFRK